MAGMFFKELKNITKGKAKPTSGITDHISFRSEDKFPDFGETANKSKPSTHQSHSQRTEA
jgi:hypothetical protein